MGAHESPEATLAAVETDAIRLRAAALVAQYDAHMDGDGADLDRPGRMSVEDWLRWEGTAYAILREVARG